MSKPFNPGPPLEAGQEFCACERPSLLEQIKAAAMALLVLAAGATIQFGIALRIGRLYGFVTVLVGLFGGWLIHLAAGRHRSITVGAIGAVSTLFAFGVGYGLLWLPFIDAGAVDRAFSWYHVVMIGLGAFVAYRLTGPITSSRRFF